MSKSCSHVTENPDNLGTANIKAEKKQPQFVYIMFNHITLLKKRDKV